MKILIATDCYINNLGGITASVLALSAGLRRSGHEVKVLSLSNVNRSFRNGDDYFIRSFPAFYYPGMRTSFAVNDPLLKELEMWGPDVIHAQTEGGAYRLSLRIMKQSGAPLVMTGHTDYGYFVFGRFRNLPPVRALLCAVGKGLYRHAVRVIVPSDKASRFPFFHALRGRLTVIPNGMELEKYTDRFTAGERRAYRASLGIDDVSKVLVAVSRLSREKNIRELIACLPELLRKEPGAKLLIVGDGPDKGRLEKLAGRLRLGNNVIFTGRVPSEDVWRCYAAGDVFVSASTFEVHSMSYLEALAAGLPLLCRADDALIGVLAHGENGLIYHTREEFVAFARRLLSEDGLRKDMARRSYQKAKGFSSDAFAAAVKKVYDEAIREKTGR